MNAIDKTVWERVESLERRMESLEERVNNLMVLCPETFMKQLYASWYAGIEGQTIKHIKNFEQRIRKLEEKCKSLE